MARRVALAVDLGSRSAKAEAFCIDAGDALNVAASSTYSAEFTESGFVEQDPEVWTNAFKDVIEVVIKRLDPTKHEIEAIVISGQMQAVVAVDDKDALAKAILYADTRAVEEAKELENAFGSRETLEKLCGNFKGAASCLAKALWISRHRPDIVEKAKHVVFGAHGYVAWRLTGRAACDRTTAQTTSFTNLDASAWGQDIFKNDTVRKELGRWQELLPELMDVEEPLATISSLSCIPGIDSNLTERFGGEIKIYHGPGDLGSTTMGAQALQTYINHSDLHVSKSYFYIGTSGWVARTEVRSKDCKQAETPPGLFRIAHPQHGVDIVASPMTTCGGNIEWIRAVLSDPDGDITHLRRLDDLVSSCQPGANGLLYLPHPNGERAPVNDPHVRAAFLGIQGSTSQGEMARAVLEGVAFHLRWLAEAGNMFIDKTEAVVVVGGGSQSSVWRQILANILARPVLAMDGGVDSAVFGTFASSFPLQKKNTAKDNGLAQKDLLICTKPEDTFVHHYELLYTSWRNFFDVLRQPFANHAQIVQV